jgi:hypothetical protein
LIVATTLSPTLARGSYSIVNLSIQAFVLSYCHKHCCWSIDVTREQQPTNQLHPSVHHRSTGPRRAQTASRACERTSNKVPDSAHVDQETTCDHGGPEEGAVSRNRTLARRPDKSAIYVVLHLTRRRTTQISIILCFFATAYSLTADIYCAS